MMRSVIGRSLVVPAVFILVVLAWAIPANALDTYWKHDPATIGPWDDPLNWTVRVPIAGDYAYIENGGTAQITGDCYATVICAGFHSSQGGHIEQVGGTVTVSYSLEVRSGTYGASSYVLNGGQVSAANESVGAWNQIFTQNGGINTISEQLGVHNGGTYILNGGQLSVAGRNDLRCGEIIAGVQSN